VAWLLRKMPLSAEHGGLLSLMIVSGGMALYATAGLLEGSGFLAVYLYGLRVRALAESEAAAASSALDGFAWAAQATMFLLLGLLVTPREMLHALWPTLAIAGTLIFVARPLAVWLCLAPLRFPLRQGLFVGWVGLRGAVPIVLALFPVIDHVPGSGRFFNVAFAVVLTSLLLQGTTMRWAAQRLGLVEPPDEPPPGEGQVQGRLMLDAEVPLADVFEFLQLPMPKHDTTSLGEWLTRALSRDAEPGEGIEWHGARFRVGELRDGRIARIMVTLARRGA
jgi:cell volume regulation protein A